MPGTRGHSGGARPGAGRPNGGVGEQRRLHSILLRRGPEPAHRDDLRHPKQLIWPTGDAPRLDAVRWCRQTGAGAAGGCACGSGRSACVCTSSSSTMSLSAVGGLPQRAICGTVGGIAPLMRLALAGATEGEQLAAFAAFRRVMEAEGLDIQVTSVAP